MAVHASRTKSEPSIFRCLLRRKRRWRNLHFINAKIHFILQLGYFKARKMFFVFEPQQVEEDIRFIREHYFPDSHDSDPDISKVTRLKQQRTILKLGNYRSWNSTERARCWRPAPGKRRRSAASPSMSSGNSCTSGGATPRRSRIQRHAGHTIGGALAYERRRLVGYRAGSD